MISKEETEKFFMLMQKPISLVSLCWIQLYFTQIGRRSTILNFIQMKAIETCIKLLLTNITKILQKYNEV